MVFSPVRKASWRSCWLRKYFCMSWVGSWGDGAERPGGTGVGGGVGRIEGGADGAEVGGGVGQGAEGVEVGRIEGGDDRAEVGGGVGRIKEGTEEAEVEDTPPS